MSPNMPDVPLSNPIVSEDGEWVHREDYEVMRAALDAEREEHTKEVEDLNNDRATRCACRFDPGVQDPVTVCAYHSCPPLSHIKQVADLRRRIAELEAQLQDSQPSEPQHYKP